MWQEPIFLQPNFKKRLWGGSQLTALFSYEITDDQIGECWGVSAHDSAPSSVLSGRFAGQTLPEIWESEPQLFGNIKEDEFPFLVKLLDAEQDLSIQVHPNDQQAQRLEGYPCGKNECWYILACKPDAEIIFGHHATTAEELSQLIAEGEWNKLLRRVKVKPGDFYLVPSGTLHAIGSGIQILEVQQNCDITYRVYDYERKDEHGDTRELHLNKAEQVITVPHNNEIAMSQTIIEDRCSVTEWATDFGYKLKQYNIPQGESLVVSVDDVFAMGVLLKEAKSEISIGESCSSANSGVFFLLPPGPDGYSLSAGEWMLIFPK